MRSIFDSRHLTRHCLRMTWNDQFLKLFRRCIEAYRGGNTDYESYYTEDDLSFLQSIGYKPRELFDFVEDLADAGEPTESTALLIACAPRLPQCHATRNPQRARNHRRSAP